MPIHELQINRFSNGDFSFIPLFDQKIANESCFKRGIYVAKSIYLPAKAYLVEIYQLSL